MHPSHKPEKPNSWGWIRDHKFLVGCVYAAAFGAVGAIVMDNMRDAPWDNPAHPQTQTAQPATTPEPYDFFDQKVQDQHR